jgi:alanine racemase
MPRPIEAFIHTRALTHNLARQRAQAPHARLWAVVKANAYGHGIERVYEGLRGADGFALLDLAEAERVRALGWRGPVLLLEGAFEARDLELCSRLDLWHVVHCSQQIDWLAAHKTQRPHRVWLKLNSGMNRLGFAPDAFRSAWARLGALPQVDEIGLMTHFANADVSDAAVPPSASVTQQVAVFEQATRDLHGERSLANSAAALRQPAGTGQGDWVRGGIMSYGSSPDFPAHSAAHWQLRPAMSLRSRLIAIQQLQAGDAVGYGSSFVAPGGAEGAPATAPLRLGIVACGYADGYPRHAGTGTPVLVDGVRTRTLGRVSMDMLAVDLTPVPLAQVGSEVTLWGQSAGGSVLPIDEVAHAAATIGYELMCALAQRVPVHTVD